MTNARSISFSLNEPIVGDTLALVLNRVLNEHEALEGVPAYLFDIVFHDGTRIGQIDLRLSNAEPLVLYGGQIGYGIDKAYRGHSYAVEACRLLKTVALANQYDQLWITCNPDNYASIRTCEKLGAVFVERLAVPRGSELWRRGDREKLRYLWQLD